jgi:zinc transport system permease protein
MPNILILDEPLSGVDVEGMELLMDMLDEIRKRFDLSILMTTHDFSMLEKYVDQVVLIREKVLAKGAPLEVLNSDAFYQAFHMGGGRGAMSLWYAICSLIPTDFLSLDFMKNALLAVLIMTPLFGILSTMIVTGRMSFFSDALGHSGFTGIAVGVLCGAAFPIYWAVGLAVLFALLFSYVRSRTSQSADTLIGVFSSTAVALGIFIATLGGGSFTKFNKYLIGDILSVTPREIGLLAAVLLAVAVLWVFASNRLVLTAVHPALASSRGISTARYETLFTVCIAVVVTLAMSWVGLMVINSLLVLPAAAARNIAREPARIPPLFDSGRARLRASGAHHVVLHRQLGRRRHRAVSGAVLHDHLRPCARHGHNRHIKNPPAFAGGVFRLSEKACGLF